jgi:hypothetical protein
VCASLKKNQQAFGFLNLFGNFIPHVIVVARHTPGLGLRLPPPPPPPPPAAVPAAAVATNTHLQAALLRLYEGSVKAVFRLL